VALLDAGYGNNGDLSADVMALQLAYATGIRAPRCGRSGRDRCRPRRGLVPGGRQIWAVGRS
jgi:hypothetical protein